MAFATFLTALALISAGVQDQANETPAHGAELLNPSEILTPDDYPLEALKANEQGSVGVAINVDGTGRVADCAVEASSGSTALDTQTCQLILQRAKFAPARDDSGNAVSSIFHQRYRWALEQSDAGSAKADMSHIFSSDDYPPAAVLMHHEGTTAVRLSIDTDGKVADCVVEESSGSSLLDRKTCSIFRTRARFTAARDRQGKPVPDTYRERITWRIEDAGLPLEPWTFRVVARLSGDRRRQDCGLDAGGALKDEAVGMAPCSEFAGAIKIPQELVERGRGKQTILVFDQQFVPRLVDSIGTPRDLRKYTFLGREVVKLQIGPDGVVMKCTRSASEGPFSLNTACDFFRPRRFKSPGQEGTRTIPTWATASLGIYSRP